MIVSGDQYLLDLAQQRVVLSAYSGTRPGRSQGLFLSEIGVYFSDKTPMGRHAHSIDSQVLRRFTSSRGRRVFTAGDFLDLGSRNTVDATLSRQARTGKIRKLARGLYDLPKRDPRIGPLMPSVELVAKALRGRDAVRLQPSGAYAANRLGLSEQVPMKVLFLTDGVPRRVRIGKLQIIIRRTTPRNMATAGRTSGLVIQALRNLGQPHVDDRVITILRGRLSDVDKRQLLKDIRFAPAWIANIMQQVAAPEVS